jgi:hypothetical protein
MCPFFHHEGCLTDHSSSALYVLRKGAVVEVTARRLLIAPRDKFLLRLEVIESNGRRVWITQKWKNYHSGEITVMARPCHDVDSHLEDFQVTHCPKGHGLRPFTSSSTRFCDSCTKRIDSDTIMMSCRLCNWDMCQTCQRSPIRKEPIFHQSARDSDYSSNTAAAALVGVAAAGILGLSCRPSPIRKESIFHRSARDSDYSSDTAAAALVGVAAAGILGLSLLHGVNQASSSYMKYSNDFELVIRATKDLGRLLETKFGAPKGAPLATQIQHVCNHVHPPLSYTTITQMKELVESKSTRV